ncbi:hypothetical protein C5Y96_10370 [Blastopirellula marina]|uniref:Uncharacterized protein n=1 Tax=Blastopirellula marina TaxID=124 RepID=A0A2S8FM26_9BACT|nr:MULTISPECIES: hypothetical protein [Pirellulaceae]PQO33249.1 hypothetical protein C5Y96_10370 [Blastopirellula marina]RCS52338.1 hypothetical protein DTL36_10380 [Bremerella cremea]
MEAAKRQVLISGDLESREFEGLAAWLSTWPSIELHAEEATQWVANFDLILLCAARPGRFSAAEVEALRQRNPLAQLIQIFGPWCIGEARTGPVPDGLQRMGWFEWSYRLPDVIEGRSIVPATSAPQEQALASLAELSVDGPSAEVGILATTAADFDYLRLACRALGHSARWLATEESTGTSALDALVGIVPGTDGAEFAELCRWFQAIPAAAKILCLGAVTWEDWQKAQSCGVTAILGQPFRLVDLATLLKPQADCGILPLVNRP